MAAGLHNEGITLARVDAAGKVQHAYEQRYNPAQNANSGEVRLMRDGFTEGELVAVTRDGDVQRINPRFIDVQHLEQSACGNSPAPSLSVTLEFFATDRAAEQSAKENINPEFLEKKQPGQEFREAAREVPAEAKAPQRGRNETAREIKGAGLKVVDAGTGAISMLSSFVESLLGGSAPPEPTEGDMLIRQQRRALAAMEDIRDSMERGENLSTADIANLTPSHLMNIKNRGDDYIREMIEGLERGREREQDSSRGRDYE